MNAASIILNKYVSSIRLRVYTFERKMVICRYKKFCSKPIK